MGRAIITVEYNGTSALFDRFGKSFHMLRTESFMAKKIPQKCTTSIFSAIFFKIISAFRGSVEAAFEPVGIGYTARPDPNPFSKKYMPT